MNEKIVVVESCQGFWGCIDANTIIISLITLIGVFASSLLTFYLTNRQHKNDVFVNHKEFYSSVDGLDKWIVQLSDRIFKISTFESLSNLELLKDEAETLYFVAREVRGGIEFDDAPYPLKKPLMKILRSTLQVSGYTMNLIQELETGLKEPLNLSEVQKEYKDLNRKIKRNHRKIKRYL
ncbi:hypothetical protein [Planococcus rifietoensis]|uniref:hypothetical protein n=1 Tax=Planococcus rifietoensis TaxID=200991 RepID=UPI00384C59DE